MLKTIELSASERQQLQDCLNTVTLSPYGAGFDQVYSSVCASAEEGPARLINALDSFRRMSGRSGVMLIRGLPVDVQLGPTPCVPYESVPDKVTGTEKYLLLIASVLGEPIGFADWHRGERLQNLYPIPELECVQCASNSIYLEMHTETAFRPNTPIHLALLCLKKDPGGNAKTVFCDLGAVVDSMSEEARRILASPSFCFLVPSNEGETLTEPKPIDSIEHGRRRLHYAEALTAIDADSRRVLADLKERILANSVLVELEKGDLVLIDNFHVVHGRTAYSPRYDGSDRWLQRVLIGRSVDERVYPQAAPTQVEQVGL